MGYSRAFSMCCCFFFSPQQRKQLWWMWIYAVTFQRGSWVMCACLWLPARNLAEFCWRLEIRAGSETQPPQRCFLQLVNLLRDEFNLIKNLCYSGAEERSFLKEICYFACRVFHPLITPLLWWGTRRRWFAVPNCSYINIILNFHPRHVFS